MSSVAALSTIAPAARTTPRATGRATASEAGAPAPSAVVSLSAAALAAAEADTGATPLSTSARFRDVGATVLAALKAGATVPLAQQVLPKDVDHRFTLSVVTAGGTKVDLALASRDDGLIVQLSADAALRDDERQALAALADGFQAAIDGMTQEPPRLRLGELAGLGGGLLQSVDLQAMVTLPTTPPATQTLAFHADAGQRSVQADGPSGKLDMRVDTSMVDSLGTRQQQSAAIDSYLKQVDQAAARGHGDAQLTTLFKDAFSDLSRTASRDGPAAPGTTSSGKTWPLAKEEHAVLTGLADFSASMTQAPQWNNPVRTNEVTAFQYELSQRTERGGDSRANRSLAQTQQARLTARFHQPLQEGTPLAFDYSAESQNYTYHQIDDTARSDVKLGYRDGRLREASLAQSVSQSERVQQYVLGRMVSEHTIPAEQHLVRDLVAALAPYQPGQDAAGRDDSREVREERRQQSLDALGQHMVLLGDSVALAARNTALEV